MATETATSTDRYLTLRCQFCDTWNRVDAGRAKDRPKCGKCGRPLLLDRPWPLTDETFAKTIAETTVPVLVDFYADWCGPCKMMDERTWVDATVVAETARFICVKLNVDEEPARAQQFGVRAVPTIAFVTPAGQIVNRATGFMEPRDLLRLMRKVR